MLYLESSGAAFWFWSKHAGAVARPVALSVAASCYVVDCLGAQAFVQKIRRGKSDKPLEIYPKLIRLRVGVCAYEAQTFRY